MADESKGPDLRDYVSKADFERLQADNEQYLAALQEQMTANEELQARVAELEPLGKTVEELTGKIRTAAHKSAFDKLADELKIRKELRDDAWKLAEFPADADEPDPKALKDHFGKFLAERKHYIDDTPPSPKLAKGAGAERGGRQSATDDTDARLAQQYPDAFRVA